jgi:hypothetical protein
VCSACSKDSVSPAIFFSDDFGFLASDARQQALRAVAALRRRLGDAAVTLRR